MGTSSILHLKQGSAVEVQQLGPYAIQSLIQPDEEASLTAYRVRIEPYQTTAVSYHKIAEELYYVIEGQGSAILNGKEHVLQSGDFLRLPPETTHGFVTREDALVMLNIHTPGSRPDHDVYFVGNVPPGFGKNDAQ
ncbi:cupin domain-containing protein [Rubellicoccus peritrichatus]|uniref:Cupin domain-containing protein n=1 Tax=Rubellicoccus peritrichatus TaxID=3080537 RepID=A0AAQ3LAN0_9BACT|nr:cupin domain-containing protein [Puniceicoccus sp. CR14]WOO40003.1 cupin domain-containing protein [Puniceicoccus sp. CR14]